MQSYFSRLPDSAYMVVEYVDNKNFNLLCVDCGWEGVGRLPQEPWPVFRNHGCKLKTLSVGSD